MKISEVYINSSEGYRFGDTIYDLSDTYFGEEASIGEIFKHMQKEYGRCASKVYVDNPDDPINPLHVGWVFEKRMQYEDADETYLREVWITLYDEHREEPIRKYHVLGKGV